MPLDPQPPSAWAERPGLCIGFSAALPARAIVGEQRLPDVLPQRHREHRVSFVPLSSRLKKALYASVSLW
jgi:hypothetical protein